MIDAGTAAAAGCRHVKARADLSTAQHSSTVCSAALLQPYQPSPHLQLRAAAVQEQQASGPHSSVTCCCWLAGPLLALGTRGGALLLYNDLALAGVVRLQGGAAVQAITRRGLAFIAGTADGALHFYDTADAVSKRWALPACTTCCATQHVAASVHNLLCHPACSCQRAQPAVSPGM